MSVGMEKGQHSFHFGVVLQAAVLMRTSIQKYVPAAGVDVIEPKA
jgi:hypothetical protein